MRKVTVELVDDLDDSVAAEETIEFSVDGIDYEIDLSAENAAQLRTDFSAWSAVGRKLRGKTTRRDGSGLTPDDRRALRAWAAENEIKVSQRGRIADDVIAQYRKATAARR